MLIAIQIIAAITVVATAISLMYRKAWWIRVFDFPRIQIIALQLFCIFGIFVFSSEFKGVSVTISGFLFIAFVVQMTYVYPYFLFTKKNLPQSNGNPKHTISIIASNVLMNNRKSRTLIDLVKKHQPDIFLAVETDEWWDNKLKTLDEDYPYTVKQPQDNTYGMLLFSKIPLKNPSIDFIVKDTIPSIHADVELDGFTFKLRCLHPEPPAPDEAETSGPRDRELIRMARLIQEQPQPHIVLGDLNDVAWSDTSYKFERISKLKDPRQGRGFFNTFHARIPLLRWALDHIFVSDEFNVISIRRLPNIGSDHFPMYFKFGID